MDLAQNFDGLRAPLSLYLTIPHLHKQVALDYIGKTQTIEEQDTLHSNTLPSTTIIRVQHNQTPCSGHKASLEQMPCFRRRFISLHTRASTDSITLRVDLPLQKTYCDMQRKVLSSKNSCT